jgi:3-oxoacyl-[acyl-carrier protein] reductase
LRPFKLQFINTPLYYGKKNCFSFVRHFFTFESLKTKLMNIQLINKTALVCGSTQGIGKAVAHQLALQGANVVLMARNETELLKVKAELPTETNQKHFIIKADFNFPQEIKVRVEQFIDENGPIHILVNNTGGPAAGPVHSAKPEEFVAAFNMHLIANHTLAQCVIAGMKTEGWGRIVNVISTSVKQPLSGLGVSNTVRGAVANWSKTLASELAPFGITVNNVLPGATNTSRLQNIISTKASSTGKSYEDIANEMTNEVPMKRFAEPTEIANAIAFLASPAASYITGINVPVDGGRTKSL